MPSSDPSFPHEPGALDDFDMGVDIGVDIGVDGTAPTRPRQQTPRRQGAGESGSPLRVIGALAAVIAVVAVIVGLMSGGDRERAESPLPAPTSPPEVLGLPDPARPDPARVGPTPTVQVPVVSDGLLRAGETCRIPLSDDDTVVAFTVPDGRTLRDCASGGLLLRDPGSDDADALGTVRFTPQPLGLTLNGLRGNEAWSEAVSVWNPVANRRSYRLSQASGETAVPERVVLVEVPGGTLVATGDDPAIAASLNELVDSVRVEGPDALPAPPLPVPGGWCGGEHFVTQVPEGWFAGEQCRWLNTSSESPIVLQCDCLPPLWVEAVDIPFDGDFGFSSVDVDRLVTRPGDSVVRIIEGLRRDANNMDRPLRAVVVDGGVKRAVVIATEFPEHVLPGHTWQRTLDAQQVLVNNLRFHSQPECAGVAGRLLVNADDNRSGIQITGDFRPLPNGTLVEATGCVDGDSVEVRLVAAPEVIGTIPAADLTEHRVDPCPSGERDFRPHEWLQAIVGDFDGDGRDDGAYVRGNRDGGSDVAVLFANGGFAEAWGIDRIDDLPSAEPIVGVGRDLLRVVEQRDRGAIVSLLDVSSCSVEVAASWPLGFVDGARHGACTADDGPLRAVRSWSESYDDRQGWVVESDQLIVASGGSLISRGSLPPGLAASLCGPDLSLFASEVAPGAPDTSLAGQHQLTLQWIETRDESTGTIDFTPLGGDRYEVDGVHEAAFGFLSMRGVLRRIDDETLAFDGTISSQIPWLNRGDPCIRRAGQRFLLTAEGAGDQTYRMQDRINCDGARTDWIDIRLVSPDS